ncbi:MAG: methionine synthase, partial [Mucinivorans sp.]
TSVSLTLMASKVSFDELAAAYATQIDGLIQGGVDIILLETFFDTLNAKAAIYALRHTLLQRDFPLMISCTLENSGRTLSGQSIEAFYHSIIHGKPISVGLNCGFGAQQLRPFVERLARVATCAVSAHPNAGLPNLMGGYDESGEQMASVMEGYMQSGLLNIVGGCCGTGPDYIRALRAVVGRYKEREIVPQSYVTTLAGLEPLYITPENNFVNIGERSNVAGSAKFARLISTDCFDEALSVAIEQVESGAQVVDVCMDAPMIDAQTAMRDFLILMGSEPRVARQPVMIDSSDWDVLEQGLKTQQGKPIVNSISLKEGEREFLRRATLLRDYGAAAVVMLFDEQGQAESYERKIEVAARGYKLLVNSGFPPQDIVFDPNILAIATGMKEHTNYAVDFIRATEWIKHNCPHAKVSGGVSNLSFAFRGNNAVREAMHSVFLYHAIAAGMDMGIVNPAMLQIYDQIEPELSVAVTDVIFARNLGPASDFLLSYQQKVVHGQSEQNHKETTPTERMAQALMGGSSTTLEADTELCLAQYGSALEVIDKVLMPTMGHIGELFGQGKMFLPQVVKSARVMKQIVALMPLAPAKDKQSSGGKRVVLATVKGDVHDIGKNIVGIVLECNGFQVIDLGVMVPVERIVEAVAEHEPVAVVLSGLITPSLEQMRVVATEFEKLALRVPICVGGATTSALHTAVAIAPLYGGLVAHSSDAAGCSRLLGNICAGGVTFEHQYKAEQKIMRQKYEQQKATVQTLEYARQRAPHHEIHPKSPHIGKQVLLDYPLSKLIERIDWNYFFLEWDLRGRYPEILSHPTKGAHAQELFDDAQAMLKELKASARAVYAIVKAHAQQEDIVVGDCNCCRFTLHVGRNLTTTFDSLADYVAPKDGYLSLFALTVENQGLYQDDYGKLLSQILCDRLASAFADELRDMVSEQFGCPVFQAGIGYPIVPNHELKAHVFDYLAVTPTIGITLSETFSMSPTSSVCGIMV